MKTIDSIVKFRINAASAKPSPPVGPILGQHGLNIMEFCKEFNARTKHIKTTIVVPVTLTIYEDKNYDFKVGTPSNSFFIKNGAKIKKGSSLPGQTNELSLSIKAIYELAKLKATSEAEIKAYCQMLVGSAKSMGIKIN